LKVVGGMVRSGGGFEGGQEEVIQLQGREEGVANRKANKDGFADEGACLLWW